MEEVNSTKEKRMREHENIDQSEEDQEQEQQEEKKIQFQLAEEQEDDQSEISDQPKKKAKKLQFSEEVKVHEIKKTIEEQGKKPKIVLHVDKKEQKKLQSLIENSQNLNTIRRSAGEIWQDKSLEEWNENDYRIFVGNLDKNVQDNQLMDSFRKYPSVLKAKIIYNKKTGISKGFGFVSFASPHDYLKAMKEMQGKFLSGKPIKIQKSKWKNRSLLYGNSKVENCQLKGNQE